MKRSWINLICDPVDGTKLKLIKPVIKNNHIISGELLGGSDRTYKIEKGIPILLPDGTQSLSSVESFAYEWDKWGYLFAKNNWLKDTVRPLLVTESKFKNKVIVDAGAGSGAQSRWMAEAGAKLVISLELSNTIFHRHKKTIKGFEDVIFPIQCDIAYPPVAIKPDILYCVNVIHHTKDPKKTFKNLRSLMKKKTIFLFNVYRQEGFLGSKTVKISRQVIRYLPFRGWRWLSLLVAFGIFALNKTAPWILKLKYRNIHFSNNFKELWLQIYDAFGAHHYQFPWTRKKQFDLFKKMKLKVKVKNDLGYLLVNNP